MLSQLKAGDLEVKITNDLYLGIFLQPPSIDEYRQRLVTWLTESDEDIQLRMQLAEAQAELSTDTKVYDHVIVNDELDTAYEELKQMMVRYRPDVMSRDDEEEAAAAEAAAAAAAAPEPSLVLSGAGGHSLAAALTSAFPAKFIIPQLLTDRKPGKGEGSTPELQFLAAKDLAKMAADGLLSSISYTFDGGMTAISKEALQAVHSIPAVAIVVLPDPSLASNLKQGPASAALFAYVGASTEAAGGAEAAEAALAAAREADGGSLYALVVSGDTAIADQISDARSALTLHVPAVVPPPYRPLVIAGPFGTGKRVLLQKLFDQLPGRFAIPVATTTRAAGPGDIDDRSALEVVPREQAEAMLAAPGTFLVHERALDHVYGITAAAVKKVQASGRVCVLELDHVADARRLRDEGFEATYIFIGVDSMDELFRCVRSRCGSIPCSKSASL